VSIQITYFSFFLYMTDNRIMKQQAFVSLCQTT
jgi:hypothetical protein